MRAPVTAGWTARRVRVADVARWGVGGGGHETGGAGGGEVRAEQARLFLGERAASDGCCRSILLPPPPPPPLPSVVAPTAYKPDLSRQFTATLRRRI